MGRVPTDQATPTGEGGGHRTARRVSNYRRAPSGEDGAKQWVGRRSSKRASKGQESAKQSGGYRLAERAKMDRRRRVVRKVLLLSSDEDAGFRDTERPGERRVAIGASIGQKGARQTRGR